MRWLELAMVWEQAARLLPAQYRRLALETAAALRLAYKQTNQVTPH